MIDAKALLDELDVAVFMTDGSKLYYANASFYAIFENEHDFDETQTSLCAFFAKNVCKQIQKHLINQKSEDAINIELNPKWSLTPQSYLIHPLNYSIDSFTAFKLQKTPFSVKSVFFDALKNTKLIESEAIINDLMEFASESLIAVFDNNQQCVYVSQNITEILGYSIAEYRLRPAVESVHPEDVFLVQETINKHLLKGQSSTVRARYRHKNGHYVWLETISILHRYSNDEWYIVGSSRLIDDPNVTSVNLEQIEKRIYSLTHHLPVHVWVSSLEGVFMYANQATLNFFGADKEGLSSLDFKDMVHPDDLSTSVEKWTQAYASGQAFELTQRLKNKEGQYIWHKMQVIPQKDESGNIYEWLGVSVNIDEQLRTRQELRETRDILSRAEAIGGMASWIHYPETNESWYSDSLMTISGVDPEIGHTYEMSNWFDHVYAEDRSKVENAFAQAISSGIYDVRYRFIRQDTFELRYMHAIARIEFDPIKKAHRFLGIVRDETKQRIEQNALEQANIRYQLATKTAKMGIWEYDPLSDKLSWDEDTFRLFGLDSPEYGKEHEIWKKVVHPEDIEQAERIFQNILHESDTQHYRFRVLMPTGQERTLQALTYVSRQPQGDAVRVVGVNWDISELVQAEVELRQLNTTKDHFFSIIAHDLNGPISNLVGLSDLLSQTIDTAKDPTIEHFVHLMQSSSKSASDLLANLITWSRSLSNKIPFEPVSMAVDELFQIKQASHYPIAQSKSIDLIFNPSPKLAVVADFEMLKTILRNLITNAIKFTHPKGLVTIGAIVDPEDPDMLQFYIQDNGTGITENIQKKLFSPLEQVSQNGTLKEKGTGLGLLICKEFVETHGGQIWFESEVGKGSTFYFTIPRAISAEHTTHLEVNLS